MFVGCASKMTPEMMKIRSVTDASNCEFIASLSTETIPRNQLEYVKRGTHKAGGNAFKIQSTSTEVVSGMTLMMTSYESYSCKF